MPLADAPPVYEKKVRKSLVVPGAVVLGLFWVLTVAGTGGGQIWCNADDVHPPTGCHTGDAMGFSLIPLAGPWLVFEMVDPYWSVQWRKNPWVADLVKGYLAVAGVAQIVGAGLLVTGIVWRKNELVKPKRSYLGGFGETWMASVGVTPQGGTASLVLRF